MRNDEVHDFSEALIFALERNVVMPKRPDGKFIIRQEKRLMAKLKQTWAKQSDYIIEKLKNVSAFKENKYDKNALEDEIRRITDNLPFKGELVETIILSMKVSLERGGKTSVKQLKLGKFGISFNVQNKKAIDFLNDKKSLELSNYRGNIHTTTKEKIADILVKAAKSGQSYQETALQIMQQGESGVFSFKRAQLIATREIGVAYEIGNRIPIDEFQRENPDRTVKKFWQTVEDDRVTPECRENEDDGWILLALAFPSGDQNAPRLGNPRCRCFTKYQIIGQTE